MATKPQQHRTVIRSLDEIPPFETEDEERAYWETHEVGDELAAQAEPLPADIVALLDRIRERRTQRKTVTP